MRAHLMDLPERAEPLMAPSQRWHDSRSPGGERPKLCWRLELAALPPPMLAACLGFLSLGRVFYAAGMTGRALPEAVLKVVRQAFCVGALPGLLLYACKVARYPGLVFEEAGHAMKAPALAAGCMAWTTVSAEAAQSVQRELGQALWIMAAVCYIIVFCRSVCSCASSALTAEDRDWSKVHPGWFVPVVGIAAASISGAGLGSFIEVLGLGFWWSATIGFLVLLPFITWRMIAKPALPVQALGTVGVYMAPASLCYVGWESVGKTASGLGERPEGEWIGYMLGLLAVCTWLGFLCFAPLILQTWWRTGPNPSYASLTFPSAIVAMAAMTAYTRYAEGTAYAAPLQVLCWMLACVAAAVCIRMYLWFAWSVLFGTMLRPPAPAPPGQHAPEQIGAPALAGPGTDPDLHPSLQVSSGQPEFA
eukprot:CAMPEP_0117592512 /NCGR_PEP_ID=MMETSP0784-20121206/72115_1 /TAXON_ID=39447 /ORGANISM="" /LENGTH=419 /DNA_ID=CAMNT_0005394325 /DNA_START=56 /DNA_END=1312 /DNA_ORIENTATION=+